MHPHNDPQQHDLHLGVMLIGCFALVVTWLLSQVLSALLYAGRIDIIGTVILPALFPVISLIVVGYITARTALMKEVPVNLHLFLLGILWMLLHLFCLVEQYFMSPEEVALTIRYGIALALFTIPLLLIGGGIARRKMTSIRRQGNNTVSNSTP